MDSADRKLCSAWDGGICSGAVLDEQFRHEPRRMSTAECVSGDPYEIVADGFKFGISFRGEVVIHGMELKEAKEILPILNSVIAETGKSLPE